jgi:hypothetical protein
MVPPTVAFGAPVDGRGARRFTAWPTSPAKNKSIALEDTYFGADTYHMAKKPEPRTIRLSKSARAAGWHGHTAGAGARSGRRGRSHCSRKASLCGMFRVASTVDRNKFILMKFKYKHKDKSNVDGRRFVVQAYTYRLPRVLDIKYADDERMSN